MDSEEIRRKRREKILQRSGIVEKPSEEVVEKPKEEISLREQMEVIESIEKYKGKVKNIKFGVIILLAIWSGYYAALKNRYIILSCFLSALIPYKFITEISYSIITPDIPSSSIEKAARKLKMFKEFFTDILLFICALTISISAWVNIIS
ncbi:hypothetical protein SteCoe_23109 [Stentor coeruleus]|uniref:Uncharacterized protein n=1 Tax=Stentor coeruleus TaxID=5963 RepID=A0A1R2BKN1_9CILI|nr:hypothetical protein SteCoe_23109 [Stentor coeruleus]